MLQLRDDGTRRERLQNKMVKGAGKKGSGKFGRLAGEQSARGYQGQCLTCGRTELKSSECRIRNGSGSHSQGSGEQPESEMDDEVGGVWIVGNVEVLEDEGMMSEGRERREVGKGTGRPGYRIERWAQIDADQRDGFDENSCNSV